jgi:hypothetical protein
MIADILTNRLFLLVAIVVATGLTHPTAQAQTAFKFCPHCGGKLTDGAAAETAPAAQQVAPAPAASRAAPVVTSNGRSIIVPAAENSNSGRIQYSAIPGSGDGAMSHLGQRLPQPDVRVGPSGNPGVGLAFLVAIEADENTRNALLMASKVEFLVNVAKVDPYNGAPPSAQKVALLTTTGNANPQYGHYGAWNNAEQFRVIGEIEADPSSDEYAFDITQAILDGPMPNSNNSVLYFAVYSPIEDLVAPNAGKHVLYSGSGSTTPRLKISE